MRLDQLWVVTDATPESELSDICFVTTLPKIIIQAKGGFAVDSNPTVYTERAEAERDARARLLSLRAAQAIARVAADGRPLDQVERLTLVDGEGRVVFEARLP